MIFAKPLFELTLAKKRSKITYGHTLISALFKMRDSRDRSDNNKGSDRF